MVMCRGCKSNNIDLVLLDDNSISYFNILTGLNVQIDDGLPQHLCRICNTMIYKFIQFRDICISVDTELKNNILSKVKIELEINDNIKLDYLDCEDSAIYDDCFKEEQKVEVETIKEEVVDEKSARVRTPKNIKHSNSKTSKEKTDKANKKVKFKEQEHHCGLCPEKFTDESSHKNHLDGHKTNNKCSICHKKFSNQYQTLAHRITHLPTGKKNCYMCHKKFRKTHYLEYHFKKYHFNETNITLECDICYHSFRSPRYLTRHFLKAHSDTNIMICDLCKKIFKTKYLLIHHMDTHFNRRKYKCTKCDFAANSQSSIRRHNICKHTIGKVTCKLCTVSFKSKDHFARHKCRPRQSKQVCPVCGKIVIGVGIRSHLISHSTENKYKCDRCPATYKHRNGLRDHLNAHDGIRKYKCEYCPMAFGSGSVLIKHRRTHTGEKPFVCNICQKGFTGNHNLKVHMKVHGITNLIVKKNQDGA